MSTNPSKVRGHRRFTQCFAHSRVPDSDQRLLSAWPVQSIGAAAGSAATCVLLLFFLAFSSGEARTQTDKQTDRQTDLQIDKQTNTG